MKPLALLSSSLLLASSAALAGQPDIAAILAPVLQHQSPAAPAAQNTRTLSEEELTTALAAALKAKLNLEGDLRLYLTQSAPAITIPAGQSFAITILQAPSSSLEPTGFLRFRLDAAGQPIGEWQLPFRAQLLTDVLSTDTPIDRGQPVSAAQLKKVQVDLLRERQPLIPASADLSGYTAATAIPAGRLLTWRDISQREVIRRGQVVEVVAQEGPMSITLKGVAMSSGGIGDEIVVRNMDSRRDITARVVSPGQARVTF